MREQGKIIQRLEANELDLRGGLVGVARTAEAKLRGAGAGAIIAGEGVEIHQGGANAIIAAGNIDVQMGGANSMIAGGDVSLTYGGAMGIAAGSATVGEGGFVGMLLSGQTTVGDGARVLFGTRQALSFGAAAGAVLAMVGCCRRRCRRPGD